MGEVITDSLGSEWEKCARKDCDLHVVRPGVVQCIGESDSIGCPDILDVYVAGLQAEIERLRAKIATLRQNEWRLVWGLCTECGRKRDQEARRE